MERPILFSGPMVQAILDGRKTQTRRVLKKQPPLLARIRHGWFSAPIYGFTDEDCPAANWWKIKSPYGQPGDHLWVRETWADVNTTEGPAICYREGGGYKHWRDFSEKFGPDYGAGPSMDYDAYPGDYVMWWDDLLNGAPGHRWKPSIFMPRWASRIKLEVVNVRVERLQEIEDYDCIKEGIKLTEEDGANLKDDFQKLWDSINGKKYPWDMNPWVWVVEFKKLQPVNGAGMNHT